MAKKKVKKTGEKGKPAGPKKKKIKITHDEVVRRAKEIIKKDVIVASDEKLRAFIAGLLYHSEVTVTLINYLIKKGIIDEKEFYQDVVKHYLKLVALDDRRKAMGKK